ncbi:hypothetical protein UFOVP699_269 [uncultured Caudovirales phage]|uniref:Uncharacterized protein n=1 Tax=uncultured Caudovirales phage TaxID=2100421 RepID=A0A6J5NKW6_9CAUD|nr:hypothetical protein UFOVP699_269 [uncultured Caudovirales phage]
MALEAQTTTLEKLGSLGESIPGLDVTAIVKNIVDKSKELKAQVEAIEKEAEELKERGATEEEAKAEVTKMIKEIVDPYIKMVETMVKEKVNEIKAEYKKIKDAITAIPEDIQAAITNIVLPPAITAPPGGPNPIYALNLAKQTKNALTTTLNVIATSLATLIKAATAISFELPAVVLAVADTIVVLSQALNTIPV